MKIFKYFLNAFSSLGKNKLRSFLSTLGIIIGIASVSIMMALGEGVKEMMIKSLSISNDTISIIKKNEQGGTREKGGKDSKTNNKAYVQVKNIFNNESIEYIKKHIGNVKYVEALGHCRAGGEMKFEGKGIYGEVTGITETYLKAKDIKIKSGMGFSKNNYKNEDKVALVSHGFVKSNLEGKNPVGKILMISGYAFQVIGILEETNDYNINYSILIPSTTAKSSLGAESFDEIIVFVNDIELIGSTKKDVAYLLMKLSGVKTPDDTKFNIKSNDEMLKEINKSIGMFKLFLGGIAGISLLVGGIGIMNIMLVSVIERTREIGIRKAIGAKKKDILLQFLVESILISTIGCIIAFAVTLLGVSLINKFGGENIKAIINSSIIVFASGISVFMGVVFGILPAWKAAKMKPIDALRFE